MAYSIFSTQHWMEVHTQSVNVSRKGVSFLAKQPLALNTVEGSEEANICFSATVSEHPKTGLSGVIRQNTFLFYFIREAFGPRKSHSTKKVRLHEEIFVSLVLWFVRRWSC
jgi:hypothetical protein